MFIYIWHLLHEDCSLYKPSNGFIFGNFGVEEFKHSKIDKTFDLHHLKPKNSNSHSTPNWVDLTISQISNML